VPTRRNKQQDAEINERLVLNTLGQQLRLAQGWDGDALSAHRKEALDYYFMRPRGDEKPGASAVVAGDLSSAVDATVAQIVEAFTSDAVAEFLAEGQDDEDQARLESDVVQDHLMHRNNGYLILTEAVKEALLGRIATIKVHVVESQRTNIREYQGVTRDVITELVPSKLPDNVEVEIVSFDCYPKRI